MMHKRQGFDQKEHLSLGNRLIASTAKGLRIRSRFVSTMPDDSIEASGILSTGVTGRSTMESGDRNADGITLSIRTTNVSDSLPGDPALLHDSEDGRTAVQDGSADDTIADSPRYSLQHVDPSLLPGLSRTLRHMAELTKLCLYFEVVGDSVSAVNTGSGKSIADVAVLNSS
jgi:hypothetical protein